MKTAEREIRKAPVPAQAGPPGGSAVDVRAFGPDELRDAVREGLTALTEGDFNFVRDRLLESAERAGLNIGGCLFLMGNEVDFRHAITATDLAQLVRYIRLNHPGALTRMESQLERVISSAIRNRKRNPWQRAA
jgi:hypothetical protein